MTATPAAPAPEQVERFRKAMRGLLGPRQRLGVAVSGGADSLALLLLAHAAFPGRVAAASVDHQLRPEARGECEMVTDICARMGVPHEILTVGWGRKPSANLQAQARVHRLLLLRHWARAEKIAAIATGHHADDQAETLLMRLARGAGISGLSGARRSREIEPGIRLVRPLLMWRRDTLAAIAADAGLTPVDDPTNRDPAHDRSRMRAAIEAAELGGDINRIAASAGHLADADVALDWMADGLADIRLKTDERGLRLDPEGLPYEIQRRLLLRLYERMKRRPPRGPELTRLITMLGAGKVATLGGLRFHADAGHWVATRPAPRKAGEGVKQTAADPAASDLGEILDLD
ncbi:tRNA lysidine(34) synthetase TilS [Sphingomicrobium arenosum]|uniref:tRNA lysidine(34) synthetase TilS n=1 Tax=Sphingomicrobium arenosum TaxID=2233861 RepID=UPI00224100D2|nr:tRNA lysidine(34) synthetase TilS [Sphingomicrobium arenosum]